MKASTGFGIALMLAASLFATWIIINEVGVPQPVEAIQGIVPNVPFDVDLTETLISRDAGDLKEASGYTFTVQSETAFTSLNKMTVTFPDGIDLTGANEIEANYELYDPNDPLGPRFEPAFAPPPLKPVSVNPAGAFGGGTIELRFGTLAPPGLQPGIIPGIRGDNITVRIKEGANIGNPLTPGPKKISVHTDTDTVPFFSAELFFGSRITLTPSDPGRGTEIKVEFYATNDLLPNQGKIIITFGDDSKGIIQEGFPRIIAANTITLQADRILAGDGVTVIATAGVTGAQPNKLVNPTIPPSFDLVGSANDKPQYRITIPDMDPAEVGGNTGSQGIADNALVSLTFSVASRINNPTVARTTFQFGEHHDYEIIIRTTDDQGIDRGTDDEGVTTEFQIPRVLKLSTDEGGNGDSVFVSGTGFHDGKGITVFLDRDGDGRYIPGTDKALATAVASRDETFTAEFTIDEAFSRQPILNQINVADSEGNSICRYATGSAGICDTDQAGDLVRFQLKGSISVSPESGGTALEFHITLRDFPPQSTISTITLGGLPVRSNQVQNLEGLPLNKDGGALIKAIVPRFVRDGEQILSVNVLSGNSIIFAETTYTIQSPSLTLTPATVVPNMYLTISGGAGFLPTGVVCASGIKIGGEALTAIPPNSRDGTGFPCAANEDFVRITGSFIGTVFVVTVPVPVVGTTMDAGIAGETVEVKVTDIAGLTGTGLLEIPKRELTVSPVFGVPQSILTVKGSGFPVENPDGPSSFNPSVGLKYSAGAANQNITVTPDAAGNFVATLQVPTNAVVPSDNAIEATVIDQNGVSTLTTTIHSITGGLLVVAPAAGPSGTMVTLSGGGFRPFSSVSSVKFAGLGALGGRTISTDGQGNFMIPDVTVPGLQVGIVDLIVDVSGLTAITVFEVTDAGLGGTAPSVLVATGLAPLEGDLERVFYFNNLTKEWIFFDPRPEFANSNTLEQLIEGQVYWIKVNKDISTELNDRIRNLVCLEGDCWNQIVW